MTIDPVEQPGQRRRPLRIVFLVGGQKFDARPWMSLASELVERGHDLHFAFKKLPAEAQLRRAQRGGLPSSVSYGVAPRRRRLSGWRSVTVLVRSLADLARYAHPRYERAPRLRGRMLAAALARLNKPFAYEPVGRAIALHYARRLGATIDAALSERAIRVLARLEDAIPSSGSIDRYLRNRAPDVVLATDVLAKIAQIDFLKSARRLGIPSGVCVASWDNLTNKGLLKVCPERVFVWNEVQRREAIELHGIPADRVVATGAQVFDEWFDRRPSTARAEFLRKVGLDDVPFVLYLGSSSFITQSGGEVEFVLRWLEALRSSGDERLRRLGVVIRPHPGVPRRWDQADVGPYGLAVVWPRHGTMPVSWDARDDFFDTIYHSAAVVGINTTAMIEAAAIGKSVLTILAPEFAQEDTLHFHHLLEENGGFLYAAPTLEQHIAQLTAALDEDAAGGERRRRFVESFVRPHGLDRSATPVFADAIEELATLPVQPAPRARPLLRGLLAVEAALCAVALCLGSLRRRLGPLRTRGARRRRGRRARASQAVQP